MSEAIHIKHPWREFWTGMMLFIGNQGTVLVDTAFEDAITTSLKDELEPRNLSYKDVKIVINTHAHGDHIEGNNTINDLAKPAFAIHPEGQQALLKSGIAPKFLLQDGQHVELGDIDLEIIHTPGHSPDSICVLDLNSKTLFTGDSVQGRGTLNIGFALYSNPKLYVDSMKKLLGRARLGDIETICLGHPELPSNGAVTGDQVIEFLETSIQAVHDYDNLARTLLKDNPDLTLEEFRSEMLQRFGTTLTPNWPELSWQTPRIHLELARSCSKNKVAVPESF